LSLRYVTGQAFFNPLAADFVLSVSVQLCFIRGAKLC